MRWLVLLALTSCATRAEPYRFRSPLLSGVTAAADRDSFTATATATATATTTITDTDTTTTTDTDTTTITDTGTATTPTPTPTPIPTPISDPEVPDPGSRIPDPGSRLPAPAAPDSETRAALLSLVGDRTDESPLVFTLRLVRRTGVSITDFADIETLIARARTSAALSIVRDGALALDVRCGNIVLFHDPRVIGVVTSVAADGTIEFIYASALGPTRAGRLIRRGFVHPLRPRDARDSDGRTLNTFVLPWTPDDAADQEYLAGELFHGIVSVRGL